MFARLNYSLLILLVCLVTALSGCKDDKAQTSEGAEGTTEVKEAALAPAPVMLFASKDIIGYGGLQSFTALKTMGVEMMKKFQFLPATAVPSMMDESLKSQMQVTSLEWLDAERPIVLVIANPQANENSGLICVPLKDKGMFEKSLPANAVKEQEGNALKLTGPMGEAVFANFLGDSHVVFTEQPQLFAKHNELLAKDIGRVKFESTIELNASGDGVRNSFAEAIKNAKAELEQELNSPESQEELASAGMTKEQVTKMLAMVDEVRSGTFGLEVVEGHLLLRGEWSATANSTMAKLLSLGSPVDSKILGLLPDSAYVKYAGDFSNGGEAGKILGLPTFGDSQIRSLLSMGGIEELSEADTAELAAAVAAAEKSVATGKSQGVWALYKSGDFPFAMVGANNVEDGAASYKAQTDLLKVVYKMVAKRMLAEMGGETPPGVNIDPTSFSKTWNSLIPMAAPFGVTLKETVQAGTDGVTVDGISMQVKYEALPMYAQQKAEMDMAKSLVGDTVGGALGASKDRVAMAFGPKASGETRGILSRSPSALSDGLKGFLARGQAKPSSILYVNVVDFLKSLAKMPIPELSMLEGLSKVAEGEGVALTFGSSKAGTAGFTFDLSLSDAAALVKAFNLSPM